MAPAATRNRAAARDDLRARALGYAIDAGPIWLAQLLGVGRVLAALAPIYVLHISIIDSRTGKPGLDDLPDAADLALHWVPGLCVWALVQALAIDLLGAGMGTLGAGLRVARPGGGTATRARLFARELLRAAPTACAMIVAGVLSEVEAQEASFWALSTGYALAAATAAWNCACVLRGSRSLLDVVSGTVVGRRSEAAATESPVLLVTRER
jgi:hypothetical protein